MIDKNFLQSKYNAEEIAKIIETQTALSMVPLTNVENLISAAGEVAEVIVGLKLDYSSVCAALIFSAISRLSEEDIKTATDSLTEQVKDNSVWEVVNMLFKCNTLAKNYTDAEGLKQMLIAITKDIRVIMIKIAEVLVFARSFKDDHSENTSKVFKAIDDIYAPIAARLGLSEIKSELQDLSFYFKSPEEYKQLEESVTNETRASNFMICSMVEDIKGLLSKAGIECKCYGRVKHISSIYNKLKAKNLTLKNIYDISAVRILVNSVTECYAALGLVHSNFEPVDGRFKDYIASPKPNGYQSLHTTVYYKREFFEVQIRTYAMHDFAEYGVAAHFLYKEHKKGLAGIDNKLLWIRKMFENREQVSGNELLEELKTDVYLGEIFVCTPKGKVIKLTENATPVDFAYMVHSEVGNRCVGAKVNGSMVPLFSTLSNGDVVEIITAQNSKGPSRDWVKRVKMQSTKDKINSFFKKQMREENIKLGKSMLESYTKSNDISLSAIMQEKYVSEVLKKSAFISVDELYAAIGYGSTTAEKVANKLLNLKLIDERKQNAVQNLTKTPLAIEDKCNILGVEGTLTKYCKCCNPIPGDDIVGYVSRGRGIIIHRKDCENVANLNPSRFVDVEWNVGKDSKFEFNSLVDIVVKNTPTIYMEITNAMGELGVRVTSLNTSNNKLGELMIKLGVLVDGKEQLNKVKNKLNSLNGVYEVK